VAETEIQVEATSFDDPVNVETDEAVAEDVADEPLSDEPLSTESLTTESRSDESRSTESLTTESLSTESVPDESLTEPPTAESADEPSPEPITAADVTDLRDTETPHIPTQITAADTDTVEAVRADEGIDAELATASPAEADEATEAAPQAEVQSQTEAVAPVDEDDADAERTTADTTDRITAGVAPS
jgi:hypothetical protein